MSKHVQRWHKKEWENEEKLAAIAKEDEKKRPADVVVGGAKKSFKQGEGIMESTFFIGGETSVKKNLRSGRIDRSK